MPLAVIIFLLVSVNRVTAKHSDGPIPFVLLSGEETELQSGPSREERRDLIHF